MRELSLDCLNKANFMTKLQQQLQDQFPDYHFNFDLMMAEKTYFKLGGPAEAYLELSDKAKLSALIKWCQQERVTFKLLGGGSNIIVADEGIKGLLIKVSFAEIKLLSAEDPGKFLIGAGVKTAAAVRKTIDHEYTGLEYFLGVPGTIGGAVYNNAHYLEDLIGQHISRVEVINQQGEFLWLDQSECEFAYDSSRFQRTKEIIYQVEFSLSKGNKDNSLALVKKATEYRAKTQPLGMPSSGCIFQNVPNNDQLKQLFPQFAERQHVPGGFLIDQAGLKGASEGDIQVSEKHAAFFVNHGTGTAAEVKRLIERVKATVKAKFDVELKEEVFWLA
jgi:UDP-N-acetylmuramate dehydrogenase